MHALANTLKKAEKDLLREAEPKRMASLDEDGLIELHKRISRARTKYASPGHRPHAQEQRPQGAQRL